MCKPKGRTPGAGQRFSVHKFCLAACGLSARLRNTVQQWCLVLRAEQYAGGFIEPVFCGAVSRIYDAILNRQPDKVKVVEDIYTGKTGTYICRKLRAGDLARRMWRKIYIPEKPAYIYAGKTGTYICRKL